ncbi:MAG: transcription antitermination factor NusB [Eubacterium ventriosum]
MICFGRETPEVSEEDRKFISNRVDAIAEKIDEIDEAINKAAVKWTTNRMSKVDLTILRLAYYEMKIDEDIPEKKLLLIRPLNLLRNMEQMIHASFVNGVLAKVILGVNMASIYTVGQVNNYIKRMFNQDFALNNIYIKAR